ncbi:hypothetical protein H6P87_00809 [Rickettsia tillamookensis]|uniref:Uncharacterized protein n=1 Tax=Rickettsia tillamookensis TaxID=2761623 RepID=A0A9E6MHL2_9RICK|nr:hypothetical protein [Rickettsia tillamookensis]QQV75257.1 hypothetical protein H6P87_00809 [Rickettsia tillamookensis]
MLNWIYNKIFSYLSPNIESLQKELEKRIVLFPTLSKEEKENRAKIKLMRDADIEVDKSSILEAIVKSLQDIKANAPYILLDLQYYKQIHLGNMMFSNFSSDLLLRMFLTLSKFHQGRFILFNKNEHGIKIIQGNKVHDLDNMEGIKIEQEYGYSVYNIKVDGLESAEYVLNVSNIKALDSNAAVVGGNLKFNNQGVPFSIIAENIENIGFDLRAASTFQEIFAKIFSYFCFSMKIYDLKNSHITGGKDTSGHYEYVNNTNTTGHLDKFQDNEIVFYENPNGNCFLGNQPEILGKLLDGMIV